MNTVLSKIGRRRSDVAVVDQAAEVAQVAIGSLVVTAVRAASVCGCRQCRQVAARTTLWAVLLLEPADEPAQSRAD
jgi:hypothetical protein